VARPAIGREGDQALNLFRSAGNVNQGYGDTPDRNRLR
jgi:hypothetical protein